MQAGRTGDITALYRVPGPPFWSVANAAELIRAMLPLIKEEGAALEAFLPEVPVDAPEREMRCRVALAGTFMAGLELTKESCLAVQQESAWASIQVTTGQGLTTSGAAT